MLYLKNVISNYFDVTVTSIPSRLLSCLYASQRLPWVCETISKAQSGRLPVPLWVWNRMTTSSSKDVGLRRTNTPVFEMVVLGAGGGPLETDCSG